MQRNEKRNGMANARVLSSVSFSSQHDLLLGDPRRPKMHSVMCASAADFQQCEWLMCLHTHVLKSFFITAYIVMWSMTWTHTHTHIHTSSPTYSKRNPPWLCSHRCLCVLIRKYRDSVYCTFVYWVWWFMNGTSVKIWPTWDFNLNSTSL